MRRWRLWGLLIAMVMVVGVGGVTPETSSAQKREEEAAAVTAGVTTRVSVASDGMEGNLWSALPSISADGWYVAFTSYANNLVPMDTNGELDVFVHDRQTGTTTRVSVASDGTEGNGVAQSPSISADGRYVAFESQASNLVAGDTNEEWDVFVHDRQTGTTTRVSVASDGTEGNKGGGVPSISSDGRYVAFVSSASNLVPGDTNGYQDIFVHDRQTGMTSRVSIASDGTQGNFSSWWPSISADGRYVAFDSLASNLVPGVTNGDIFVHDRQTGTTTRVSVASDGAQGNGGSYYPSISADGRYVAFGSYDSNLVAGDTNGVCDIFVHDRQTGTTTRVSVASDGTEGNAESRFPSISADGRYVVFESGASNLVPGDTNDIYDVFVHDWQIGTTSRVSVASNGMQGNGGSYWSSISADGRYVVFESFASNLVAGDTNGDIDVFVHNMGDVSENFSIFGRITDDAGVGMVNVSVTVQEGGNAITDMEGYYTIQNLAPGQYKITASKQGFIFSPIEWNIVVPPDRFNINFSAKPVKQWTLMFYISGDDNNSKNQETFFHIFNSIEAAANNPNVNILALWDQYGENNTDYYWVQYDHSMSSLYPYQENVNKWSKGELNTGRKETLTEFVRWAKEKAPATHYALIMSGHGGGIGGLMVDNTPIGFLGYKDRLTVKEFGEALDIITSNGISKIDVLYAHACLMAMIEPAYQIMNAGDYYVASEGILKGHGEPFKVSIDNIKSTTTPLILAKMFSSGYSYVMEELRQPYTISVGKLNALEEVHFATDALAVLLNSSMHDLADELETVHSTVQRYIMTHEGDKDFIDLFHFAFLIQMHVDREDIQEAAQQLMNAINNYVIDNHKSESLNRGEDFTNSFGISVFFPEKASSFYNGGNYDFAIGVEWPRFALENSDYNMIGNTWGKMLVTYFQTTLPDGPDNPYPPEPLSFSPVIIDLFLPLTIR